ncbi:MAG: V-type ATP synthase subunit E, partial [Spirochaetota bacterium]|nr:V-type ATP synthase subunit E [Spirochaetota bacterium]
EIIVMVISKWHPEDPDSTNLSLLLPEGDRNILEEHFIREVIERFNRGITVSFDQKMKTGFKISPVDGNYRISFMDEDFIELFKTFLRPRLISFLFETENPGM